MNRTLVVVPTRNRAGLARTAIGSALSQEAPVHILVSDNSTEAVEADDLRDFCAGLDSRLVTYLRPPASLAMTPHWEWALERGLERGPFTHVLYLTDRMVIKAGALRDLLELVERHPSSVISYNHDRVDDDRQPVTLEQRDATNRVFSIPSRHLLGLTARAILPPCLPRMLNSITPLETLTAVRRRFGTVFGSFAPDYAFCYRVLACVDAILYYDRPLLIHYALDRSNGVTYARGIASKDNLDFMANLGSTLHNGLAPVPAFHTATNPIFHEYRVARAAASSEGFPEIDRFQYLGQIGWDAREIRDPRLKASTAALLRAQGWRPYDQLAWVLPRIARYLKADPAGALLGAIRRPRRFRTAQAAIDYANQHPRRARPHARHFYLWFLMDPPGGVREIQAASVVAPATRAA